MSARDHSRGRQESSLPMPQRRWPWRSGERRERTDMGRMIFKAKVKIEQESGWARQEVTVRADSFGEARRKIDSIFGEGSRISQPMIVLEHGCNGAPVELASMYEK